MEILQSIYLGFEVCLTPLNLSMCFVGCFIGTLIGVLPGIGPAGTIALLLPVTFALPASTAIIMLAGIFYGAMYGGSTTSILLNIPGEAASVITCIDGYQMARQGRAGRALGISAIGSFIAGTFSAFLLMLMAPPIAKFGLRFGPAEFFSLIFFGLTMLAYLSSGSAIKAFAMAAVGIIIGTIGIDNFTGVSRFTFGISDFFGGLGMVPVIMGLFGVGEVLINVEEIFKRQIFETAIKGLLPDKEDWKASAKPIARGTLIGFFLGILPGSGNIIATFISYTIEKRFSRHPEKFGKGAIEGVAAPESANNSAIAGAFVPLLTLGIPTAATTALLLGALRIHGVIPGPLLMGSHPDVFWGVIISMYIGNVMLLILNLPLIGIWVKMLKVPYGILFPLILLFCLIGVYANDNSLTEINIMILFGFIGYLMRKTGFEPAPLVYAFILCPMFEESFRQALIVSGNDITFFFTRPISAILLFLSFIIISGAFVSVKRKKMMDKIQEAT